MLHALVHPTDDRRDVIGEFIVRLSPEAQAILQVTVGDTVIIRAEPKKRIPGYPDREFEALAVVYPLSRHDSRLRGEFEADSGQIWTHLRMDVMLREALGLKTVDEDLERAKVTVTRSATAARPGLLATSLGYQYKICRVQKALSVDAETPLSRTSKEIIQNLGLKDSGIVVVVSEKGQVTTRIQPTPNSDSLQLEALTSEMTADEIGPRMDYDKYLYGDVKLGWRVPDIHIDLDTRRRLGVVPGQTVWIRREPVRLMIEKVPLIISPIVIAFFTTIIKSGEATNHLTCTTLTAGFLTAIIFLAIYAFEIRSMLQLPPLYKHLPAIWGCDEE